MIPKEVLKRIRRIELKTARRVSEVFAGSWHSAFKGRGIEFEEVRPYQIGDDVRAIDWNVTARNNEPYIKLFREERELSVVLLVDISRSLNFGTTYQTKRELLTEFGATIAMSAIRNNDRVGLTAFSDDVELSLPPRNGSRHVLRIIRELLFFTPTGVGTDLQTAIDHLNRVNKRRVVVFLVSDFFDAGFESTLRVAANRHDIIPVVVQDPSESQLPACGMVRLADAETGEVRIVDSSSRRVREFYAREFERKNDERFDMLRRLKLSPLFLQTGTDFIEPLRRYLNQREVQR